MMNIFCKVCHQKVYIVDIVFYGENNIGIVCVVIIVGLFAAGFAFVYRKVED